MAKAKAPARAPMLDELNARARYVQSSEAPARKETEYAIKERLSHWSLAARKKEKAARRTRASQSQPEPDAIRPASPGER